MLTTAEFHSTRTLTPEQEAILFTKMRLANGVYKQTCDHRMDDLNEIIVSRWRETAFQPTEIMDVGASSGISTAEWVEAMSRAGLKVRVTATDLALWAYIVPLWLGAYALKTSDGTLLQHFVFGAPLEEWKNLPGYSVLYRLTYRVSARRQPSEDLKRLLLVSPRSLRYAEIKWEEDDVLAPNPKQFVRRFDAVRAANILNHCYFSADQLQRAVANLKQRLAGPGARLIVNRTLEDGSNHATMFRLSEANRFEVETRLGLGSEIEGTVLIA
jgi:hypothetical protein